jgi:hypothetical protein
MRLLLCCAIFALLATSAEAAKRSPDLVVSRITAPSTVAPGASVKLTVTTKNTGKARSGRSVTTVRLGKTVRRSVKALAKGKTAAGAVTLAAPATAGAHTVEACADGARKVKERKEGNNCRRAELTVTAPGPSPQPAPAPAPAPPSPPAADGVNLTVADVSDPPAAAREGTQFSGTETTVNAGSAGAAASTVRFYLSPDSALSLQERTVAPHTALRDVRMGGVRELGALGAGARSEAATLVTVPLGTQPGRYHLLACADDRTAVAEAGEGDNCAVATHPENGVEVPTPVQVLAEGEYRVDAFSDIFDQPDEADDVDDLRLFGPTFCKNPAAATVSTLPAALDSVRAFLAERAPNGQALFAQTAFYDDATRLQEAAGGAITMGRPGAALAALVRAHELEPGQASHLVNAAAVASSVGLPSEALAMLDAAERLEDRDRPAMGIGRHAIALNNRGAALAMLGRLGEADRVLEAAAAAEPLLSEARSSRAATTVCAAGPEAAAKFLRAGRHRQPPKPLDSSRGKATELRKLELPGVPKEAAQMREFFQRQSAKLLDEIGDHNTRAGQLGARIAGKRDEWTRAQRRRYSATFGRLYDATGEADIRVLDEAVDAKLDEVIKLQRDFWGDNEREDYEYRLLADAAGDWCAGNPMPNCFAQRMNDTCRPKLRIAHQAWRDELQETYAAAQTLVRAATRRLSGYAVNFADPDAHALALLQVSQHERAVYGRLLQWAQYWTHSVQLHADHCVEPLDPPSAAPAVDAPEVASDAACSPFLKAISGAWALGPMKLKVSCERIQQSFKAEVIPWVQAYSEVSYNFRSGRLSVFGGVKGEADAGVGKLGFKSGMYVNAERDGAVDVGWRVGPSVTVGAGPVEFEVVKDDVDISIVSTVSAMLGLDG